MNQNRLNCGDGVLLAGDNCQTQSQTLVEIKTVISTASTIAIIIIVSFYMLIIMSDLSKYVFCRKKKIKHKKQETIENF